MRAKVPQIALLICTVLCAIPASSQPPPPPPNPCCWPPPCICAVPVNSGAVILIAIGLLYGIYSLYKLKKKNFSGF